MLAAALLLPLLAFAPADDGLPRSPIPPKELDKCAKDVASFFDALERESTDIKARGQQQAALDAINKAVTAAGKKAKVDAPLKFVGDWEHVLEAAKPEDKTLKAECGKGFFRYQFVDKLNGNASTACLLSLPTSYAKGEELLPSIVVLKAPLALKGAALEEKAKALATAIYTDVLETHIVLLPLGKETGAAGKGEIAEVGGSWFADAGQEVLFTCFRVLLEQVRFDRSRVVIDGWGDAGVDALRVATNFPSWFSGVIVRSGDVGGDEMLLENLGAAPLLYVEGKTDARGLDTAALQARKDVPAGITVVSDAGSALAPAEETRKAVTAWLGERRRSLAPESVHFKFADQRYQGADWVKATRISRRDKAVPSDKDFPRVDAKVDRAANKITIETVNVLELQVFLSDALVDLDKTVVISVNGKDRESKKFPRDLRRMLENRFYNNDGYSGLYPAYAVIEQIDPNAPASEPEKKKP